MPPTPPPYTPHTHTHTHTVTVPPGKCSLMQIASQILQKTLSELCYPSRAWKVNLVGEEADDAGGVFDETIAQMCVK